jgi:hypothetical protein
MEKFFLISIVLLFLIIIFSYFKSNYLNCQRDNRNYPEGRIPGSDLTLTKAEMDNKLVNFIKFNPN